MKKRKIVAYASDPHRKVRKDEKMKEENKRNRYIKVRVTEEELAAFKRKFENSGMRTFAGFLRAMILDGYIVHFDEDKLREIYRLATSISNNINQIHVQVSRTDKSFEKDFEEIRQMMDKIWQPLNFFTAKALQLRH